MNYNGHFVNGLIQMTENTELEHECPYILREIGKDAFEAQTPKTMLPAIARNLNSELRATGSWLRWVPK